MAKKVLIVEDDKMLCTVFEMFINDLGYKLIGITHTGKSAIDLCSVETPDIILMDIHLAGEIDGIETARIIHSKYNLPVIYVSSDIEEETIKRSIIENTYGFLVKPIYKTILGISIEFACAKHEFNNRMKIKA